MAGSVWSWSSWPCDRASAGPVFSPSLLSAPCCRVFGTECGPATKKIDNYYYFFSLLPPRGFDLPTLGAVSRRICTQDHGAPLNNYWSLKLKLNCLFWSFHLYIVNVKKRPTKPWRLIQHRLMPFYQVFGVLQDKRETLSIQIYAGFSRLLAQSASLHALVVLKSSHHWCPHATLLAILDTMT